MIVASHQPDLLPYSGFWYKMAKADVFDLKIYDQLVDRGYQRRVKMRDRWQQIPIEGGAKAHTRRIKDTRISPDAGVALQRAVTGRYGGSPFWRQRRRDILDMIGDAQTNLLWQYNLNLILMVRDYLGIRTPIGINGPGVGLRNDNVISVLKTYGDSVTYLSGTGARVYMGDCHEYTEAGIDVVFSQHKAVTGDSILSVIFDYDDPMEIIMLEHESALEGV